MHRSEGDVTDVFRLMTYNVHGCVGMDRALAPGRVARVIERSAPDVVALQEVDVGRPRSAGEHQARVIADRLGYGMHFTSARDCAPGEYGNAVLTRWPFEVLSEGVLPFSAGEQRAVQWLRIHAPHETVDVLNTHLSLNASERWLQVAALLSAEWLSHKDRSDVTVVCGDFNAPPWSRVYQQLTADLDDAQVLHGGEVRNTWPSLLPVMRLDHVLVSRRARVVSCTVPRDALARIASDHLPVVVDIEVIPPPEEPSR